MLKACGLGCRAQGFWDLLGNLGAWGFSSSAKICQLWLYKLFIGVPYAAVEFFVKPPAGEGCSTELRYFCCTMLLAPNRQPPNPKPP